MTSKASRRVGHMLFCESLLTLFKKCGIKLYIISNFCCYYRMYHSKFGLSIHELQEECATRMLPFYQLSERHLKDTLWTLVEKTWCGDPEGRALNALTGAHALVEAAIVLGRYGREIQALEGEPPTTTADKLNQKRRWTLLLIRLSRLLGWPPVCQNLEAFETLRGLMWKRYQWLFPKDKNMDNPLPPITSNSARQAKDNPREYLPINRAEREKTPPRSGGHAEGDILELNTNSSGWGYTPPLPKGPKLGERYLDTPQRINKDDNISVVSMASQRTLKRRQLRRKTKAQKRKDKPGQTGKGNNQGAGSSTQGMPCEQPKRKM